MTFRLLLSLFYCLCLPLPAIPQTQWQTLEIPRFRIYYADSERLHAGDVSAIVQSAYPDLSNKLGIELAKPVHLFLAPSVATFEKLTGNMVPHWGEGVADATQNLIIVKSPSISDNYKDFPKLIRHELVHILVGQALDHPQTIPRWFAEGIAIHFSGDEEFAGGEAISKALLTDSIIPLDEIDDVLRFQSAKARLAYEESYSFTKFIEQQFGEGTLIELVREFRTGKSFEQTFRQLYQVDLFEVELQWYEFIEDKYRWRFLLDFETFLWIFILFLFIFVFLMIRLRNRRILKRWEQEERLAG